MLGQHQKCGGNSREDDWEIGDKSATGSESGWCGASPIPFHFFVPWGHNIYHKGQEVIGSWERFIEFFR